MFDTIHQFDQAVEQFNDKMTTVFEREIARIDLEERIRANAGKDLDYFHVPSVVKRMKLIKNKHRSE